LLNLIFVVRGKNFIITGANSGLGKACALEIAKRGGEIHMLCRSKDRGEEAKDEIVKESGNDKVYLHIVDISEASSIIQFVDEWYSKNQPCHVLVNNAGVLLDEKKTNSSGEELTFATNLLGSYLLTELMAPILVSSASENNPSRVISVSSGGMYTRKLEVKNIEHYPGKTFDGVDAYANTKRAQIYLNSLWAKKYKKESLNFYCMHPGWAGTPGVEKSLPSFYDKLKDKLRSSEEGADTAVWLAVCDKDTLKKESGHFYFDREHAETHLWGAGTESPISDVRELWDKLESYLEKNRDSIPKNILSKKEELATNDFILSL